MKRKITLFTLIFLAFTFLRCVAQETENAEPAKFKPTLHFKGYSHFNFAAGIDTLDNGSGGMPMGFSVRRLRLMPHGEFTKNISWGFQFGFDKLSPGIYDAYTNFRLVQDFFQIKAGLFAGPGSSQGALMSSTKIILVQRAPIVQHWGGNFLTKGYRDMGVMFHGKTQFVNYALMIANADANSMYLNTSAKHGGNNDNAVNGLKESFMVNITPIEGLNVGTFMGFSSYTLNTSDEHYISNSLGIHANYRKDAIHFMSEYIMGKYDDTRLSNADPTEYSGFYAHGGYVIAEKYMPVLGFDMYTPNGGDPDRLGNESYMGITVGINVYIGDNLKLQANYMTRSESDVSIDNDLFICNLQYKFAKKDK